MAEFGTKCLSGQACGQGNNGSETRCKQNNCSVGRLRGGLKMPVIMFGLLCLALGLLGMSAWWWSVVEFIRGVLPMVLVFVGVLALASGVSGIRKDGKVSDERLSTED